MSKAVIVDIDGTVADKGDRDPYDWLSVGKDAVIGPIRELVRIFHREGYLILYVSGRSVDCFYDTYRWLRLGMFPWDMHLYMRKQDDYRPDEVVKKEVYRQHIEPHYDVKYVLDDRNKVVRMWRELGLTVLQVAEGDF